MSPELSRLAGPLLLYMGLLLGVGLLATRSAGRSPEDYFLAGRKLGTLVLFMALFGTNATAFIFIGVPGRAYHDGISVFSVNAPIVALFTPLTFFLIGVPARRLALELGALTPAELYARRLNSPIVGFLLFLLFTAYTIPYMVSAVIGASVTLEGTSAGAIPAWLGGLFVIGVVLVYTALGGMRATAWTNVLQGVIFLGFLLLAFFFITRHMGGAGAAMQRVAQSEPGLLTLSREGAYAPPQWISWSLVMSLTVVAFPHMFARLLAASGEKAIQGVCRIYPLGLLALWLPPVLIGVWGAAEFPGLEGRASDRIFQLMVDAHVPSLLAGFGLVAILAAVMSSLDAMILTLGSMLVRDVLDQFRKNRGARADVTAGRLFSMGIAAGVYLLAQVWGSSVFSIASMAFFGYVSLFPTLWLGVRWSRFTATGAIASLLAATAVLYLGQFGLLPTFGFLPVFWALLAGFLAGWLGSVLRPPS